MVAGHFNSGLFNSKLQPQIFNHILFNHEILNPKLWGWKEVWVLGVNCPTVAKLLKWIGMVEKFMVEKYMI